MPHRGISQSGYGLREQSLSPLESFAQSLGSVAPTATPTLVIPLVFALGGNATWLIYLIATIGIILVARIINQFSRHTASPGSLYAYTTTGLGPWVGRVSAWALLAAYAGTGAAVTGGFANYVKVLIFGWIDSFASCGFILSYILVSLAAPIYLYTHHSPSIATVLSAGCDRAPPHCVDRQPLSGAGRAV